ncbi:MAG: TIGR02452 family protein [Thiocapsa sp.]|uniref:TIGR02452 family protein n=1 Tax=Thiocapsa sp. TaxID=2024551 RepID=UPI001BCC23DD|nr:TIGR02452 family protein [Thiocapsa sp.]QVL48298.1 MAG: TIGR02452 family protein [Thiocapsa sp.]
MSVIAECLSRVTIGSPMQHGQLTLFPLLADGVAEPGYRLLDAALADGTARVTEVSASGSVPELCFVNDGDRPVLLLDGEELIGAKQNRILNLTILAPAHKTITIPVSCVEQGRWHAQSTAFASARRAHFATGRARKAADVTSSLRRRGSRESDQGAVWRDIAEKSRRFGVASATGAAADIYASRREALDAYRNAFTPQPNQCGALFAVNGRVVGLDLFDSPVTLAAVLGTLVESYALDALDAQNDVIAEPTPADPRAWLDAVGAADVERFAALGEGEDWRLFGPGLAGGALVKDGHPVHLCVFAVDHDDDDMAEPGAGAARSGRLGLELATDRHLIRRLGRSRRYLHLRLRVPRSVGTRRPLDLALVLDRSGSMGGGKWAHASGAAQAAIARLGSEDRVALVVFDEQVDTLLPLCRAHEAQAAAARVLDGVGPRGGTDLAGGWLTGCALIGRADGDERLHRCFLLSDGQANQGIVDPAILAHHAAELCRLGVVTGTFGVGDDYDEVLLGALADAGGGAFHDIARAETMSAVMDRELGDALEVVYAAPRIQLEWASDLQMEVLGPWTSTAGVRSLTIQPGDLASDQVLDLLVAVRFPPGAQDTECAVQVRVTDGAAILAQTRFDWTWVDSARRKAQPHDRAVEQRVGEWLASRARLAATAANRAGDLKQARAHLREGAAAIRAYGAEEPALRALAEALDAECEQHRTRQTPRDLKERLYRDRNRQSGRTEDGGRHRGEPSRPAPRLQVLPAVDSREHAETSAHLRAIPRQQTAAWGKATVTALGTGLYTDAAGRAVDWRFAIQTAVAAKRSLPPDAPLPGSLSPVYPTTRIQVANETSLAAARRLSEQGQRVLALNFANGIEPGGGFLQGHRGQESVLCRSSALFATLQGGPMYADHATRPLPDSTDWAILSPDVPVFRTDDGTPLERPWLLSVITCAAPYAPTLGVEASAALMESRIRRVLAVARAFGYEALVLGAWGCGTYGNDPARIAAIFHAALREQAGAFAEVVFAVTDGASERAFFGPFAAEFGGSR